MLAVLPDRKYVKNLLEGTQSGFRIGVSRNTPLSSTRKNILSALEHPQVMENNLQKELERGVLLGLFQPGSVPEVAISRFGVIPKGGQPDKWRLIVDLFLPEGRSVNDAIQAGAVFTLLHKSGKCVGEAA